tara:strand:- start:186 stop:713 length:528 start_codon:yes stop_codon:yes gene_type:complete
MPKKTQLNITVDEKLLKDLKYMALEKNIKLNTLVKGILSEKMKLENLSEFSNGYSEKDAINFHNFMTTLFEKTSRKLNYSTKDEAFKSLIPHIEIFDHWEISNTVRLRSILLESGEYLKPDELNNLCSNREYEGPIYSGLRDWIGSNEFPSKKLICDLGSSLVPILENNIKKKKN